MKFNVTYEICTPESVENGESEENGFIAEGVSLRDALEYVNETESCHCNQTDICASSYPVDDARWVTVYNSSNYLTGVTENRSIHFPDAMTVSSRKRVMRLMGIRV